MGKLIICAVCKHNVLNQCPVCSSLASLIYIRWQFQSPDRLWNKSHESRSRICNFCSAMWKNLAVCMFRLLVCSSLWDLITLNFSTSCTLRKKTYLPIAVIYSAPDIFTHQDPCDRLRGSQITQQHCSYFKLEYLGGYAADTTTGATEQCSSYKVPLGYPHNYINLQ